jgi:hypothetical protein
MAKDLAIAVIHGIGSQDEKYSEPMQEEIDARLGAAAQRIAWGEIWWADITEKPLGRYLDDARKKTELDYYWLRKLLVSTIGDAAAYQRVKKQESAVYGKIHARVRAVIEDLHAEVGQRNQPLLVLAHSLGSQIMSNYVWDLQHDAQLRDGRSAFEAMKTLTGMITFGSNIPLFALAHEKPVPITFPPAGLKPEWKAVARWHNYYDPDDVLAYPIKPLPNDYGKVVNVEKAINVGNPLTSWNPATHAAYWTDNSFTVPTARYIARVLRALPEIAGA